MAENDALRKVEPGTVRLFELLLTNGDGESIDILNLVVETEITESIYSLFATYRFTLVDAVALLEKYIITGNEKLKMTLVKKNDKKSDDEFIVKDLVISSIDQYAKIKGDQQVYRINCVHETAMAATVKRVSRSVKGNITTIAGDLFDEVAYNSPLERLDESAEGTYKIVLPNRTYVRTIQKLLTKAQNTVGNMYFMFETLWHDSKLTSYKEIVGRPSYEEYKESFSEQETRGAGGNFEHNKTKIKEVASELGMSHYQSFRNGAFISKVYDIDISNKKMETIFFDITADGGSLPSLEVDYMLHPDYKIGNKPYSEFVDATHYMVHRNPLAFHPEGADHNIQEKNNLSIAKRRAVLDNQNAISHTITVNADTNLRAGETIDLKLTPALPMKASGNNKIDDLMSGKYYIATVVHKMDADNRYSMDLHIKKDTFTKSRLAGKYSSLG